MKHSHYTTPRTMRDGQWSYGATDQPYRQHGHLYSVGHAVVNIVSVLALIFVVGLVIWESM